MPLQKLQFRPGVNREGTSLANEGGWFESDKVRFRSGYPEKIGGWVQDSGAENETDTDLDIPLITGAGSYLGVCRSLSNWLTLAGYNSVGLGTNLKFYIQTSTNGTFYDVTPIRLTSTIASNAFTTVSGSTTVRVNDTSGVVVGDYILISGVASAVNGIPASDLNREFVVTSVLSASQYTITVATQATSSGTTGACTIDYEMEVGGELASTANGWGAGGWGGVTAGFSTTSATTLTGTLPAIAFTTLAANLTISDTTVNVLSTSGFASPSGSILIDSEVISYAGVTSTSFTGCTRGASSTTAAAHTGSVGVAQYTTGVTVNCASTTGFAASGTFYITANGSAPEAISYSGVTSTSFTGCTRGVNGTPPSAHAAADAILQYVGATGWGQSAAIGFAVNLRLWSQSNFGENLLFNARGGAMNFWAVNATPTVIDRGQVIVAGGTITQKDYTSGGTTTVNIDATCPSEVNYLMVSDSSRFTIAFGCNDPTGVYSTLALDPLQIRWSDQESYSDWTPAATNQAGNYRLSHGSQIVTAVQTRQEILVLTDTAIYSMQFLGAPYVWGFQLMGDNISIVGPNAAVTVNNITYWMGVDKFYMYSGRVETLPCSLRQFIYDDIDLNQGYQVFSGTNEGYNEIWWFYCSSGSTTVDRYVIYNHLERTWVYGTLARTAWLDSPLRSTPIAAGYNGKLIYQENGNDDGTTSPPSPIYSYVRSSDFDIGDGHNFGLVWRVIPDVTFDGSTVNTPQVNFTVLPRANPGANYGTADNPAVASTQNYQNERTYNVQQFTQFAYVRIRGRQMAFQISSEDLGVSWQLGSPRLDVRPDGRR